MSLNVVFMGTPSIGASVLQALLEIDVKVVAVVTQPDKKVGRKQVLQASPVKELALENNLVVYQPLKPTDIYSMLSSYDIDGIVTCAFGMFLPQNVLDLAKKDAINVHASLLPKYRGGAPIHHAIINGEKFTGITIMRMIKKMDAGAMFVSKEIEITFQDTTSSVYKKLSQLAYDLTKEHVLDILNNKIISVEQNEEEVTFAPIITREDERINVNQPGEKVYNHLRGLLDFPGGYVIIDGLKVKLYDSKYIKGKHQYPINSVIGFEQDACVIALDGGLLHVYQLQVENKKKMLASQIKHGIGKQWINKEVK